MPDAYAAEQQVLGGLMIDASRWDDVAGVLVAEDFADKRHRTIFAAMQVLAFERRPLEPVMLSHHLERVGELQQVGGLAYLGEVYKETPTAANIMGYVSLIQQATIDRQLVQVASEIRGIAEGKGEVVDKLDRAQALVMGLADQSQRAQNGPAPIKRVLARVVDSIDQRFNNGGAITGLATGFTDFDEITAGLHAANLVIIAGRPSMGKTTFAMNIAEHVALNGQAVGVFSMEMSAEELAERQLASVGRVDMQTLRTGQLQDGDWVSITGAMGQLAESGLLIDDTPALTVHELRARARRLKRDHDIALAVVDYLQLMSGEGKNRNEQIEGISRGLKALAKELKIPVIALSQLNRAVDGRPNKRPTMSDLRDSGAIEQDADLIAFLYRDEVYNPDGPFQGLAELKIGKQRNGRTGTVRLTFLGPFVRFENHHGEWPQPEVKTRRYAGGFDYAEVEH